MAVDERGVARDWDGSPGLWSTPSFAPGPGQPHRLTLSFSDASDERRFWRWYFDRNVQFLRAAGLVLALSVTLGGPLERLALPGVWPVLWLYRYGVMLPAAALALTLFSSPLLIERITRDRSQEVIFGSLAVGFAGTAAMGYAILAEGRVDLQLYCAVGYVLMVMFAYIGTRLRFTYAAALGLGTWVPGAYAMIGASVDPFITEVAVGVAAVANLTGMYGAYALERGVRRQYAAELTMAAERRHADDLLDLVLPAVIAARLREHPATLADTHDSTTVLFADIVGFTPLAGRLTPADLVALLNRLFWAFDSAASRHHVEKIKTIGDAWMAVAGAPERTDDHAAVMAELALELVTVVGRVAAETGLPIRVRVGLHSGPIVAGVIGRRKRLYDLWGDTVNIASRMESQGEPDQIQLSEATRARLGDRFSVEPRGPLAVRGVGEMNTWWLLGSAPRSGET